MNQEVIHKQVIAAREIIFFLMRGGKSIVNLIGDIVFPKTCSGCGDTGFFLCEKCFNRIPRADPPLSEANSFITAVFDYRNQTVRNAIWRFKYKNAREIAECFGRVLYEEIIDEIGNDLRIGRNEKFLLIPIPLHKTRLRERGYNQSELLAREILKYDTEKIFIIETRALSRTRATNAQAKKEKRDARFENLRGAFAAFPEFVNKENIILIDDVTTTGATLAEARKMLIKAGAKTVRAYTVAH